MRRDTSSVRHTDRGHDNIRNNSEIKYISLNILLYIFYCEYWMIEWFIWDILWLSEFHFNQIPQCIAVSTKLASAAECVIRLECADSRASSKPARPKPTPNPYKLPTEVASCKVTCGLSLRGWAPEIVGGPKQAFLLARNGWAYLDKSNASMFYKLIVKLF